MSKEIVKQWVEENIYPRVSPKFKYATWAVIFFTFMGLAGSYDVWFITNF